MTAVVRPTVASTQIVDATGANTVAVDASGVLSVKTGTSALDVSQPGLSGGVKTTWISVPTTANAYLPAAPLAGRATSLVQAWEGNPLPIFIGEAGITARVFGATPGANDGILLLAGQNYPNPVAAGVLLCMRATATGCYVGIQEVAA